MTRHLNPETKRLKSPIENCFQVKLRSLEIAVALKNEKKTIFVF